MTSAECIFKNLEIDRQTGEATFRGIISEGKAYEVGQQILVSCPVEDCMGELELSRDTPDSVTGDINMDSVRVAKFNCKAQGEENA
jgi:hypothetical protein